MRRRGRSGSDKKALSALSSCEADEEVEKVATPSGGKALPILSRYFEDGE